MDSYFFGWYLGRPASPPLPDGYTGDYLPQMPAYSDASQSGRSSGVPQPIDFGGSVTGYSSDTSQSRHSSVTPIEYDGASQQTSSQSHRPRRTYTAEDRAAVVANWRNSEEPQRVYARSIGIPNTTLRGWIEEAGSSAKSRPSTTHSRNYYTPEEKSATLSEWQARRKTESLAAFSERTGIPRRTLQEWIKQEKDSSKGAR